MATVQSNRKTTVWPKPLYSERKTVVWRKVGIELSTYFITGKGVFIKIIALKFKTVIKVA